MTFEQKILVYEMVANNPSAQDIYKSIEYKSYLESKKMPEEAREDADKMGIDMDEVNRLLTSGELNT